MASLPVELQEHWQVFSEELAQRFLPSRNPDMTITFVKDTPSSINCKPYPKLPKEKEHKQKWIKQEVQLGRLIEKASQYNSPLYFIPKKDSDELRPILNYQQINAWTKRDHNPIPSIKEAMDALQGKSLFSKMDIHWGYNNI
jgi:hypothetical protein